MSKNAKLLLGMSAVTVLIISYFIFTTRLLTVEDFGDNGSTKLTAPATEPVPEPVDLVALENDYKKEAKDIVTEFETLAGLTNGLPSGEPEAVPGDEEEPAAGEAEIDTARISQLRDRLLDITVPTQFKDLHLTLVLALGSMENYLIEQTASSRDESISLITQAKLKNDWLN